MKPVRIFWPGRLFLALLVVTPATTNAQIWSHYEDSSGCSFDAEFADGTRIAFGLVKTMDWVSVHMRNANWASLQAEERFQISISFDGGPRRSYPGEASVGAGATPGIFIPIDGLEFAGRAMAATSMRVQNGANLVGVYSMSGTRAAFMRAAECTARMANRHAADPFAN